MADLAEVLLGVGSTSNIICQKKKLVNCQFHLETKKAACMQMT